MNITFAKCRACDRKIIWATTPAGRAMPLDAEPSPLGNRYLDANGCTGPVQKGDVPDERLRYFSHFAGCPNAAEFRRKKQ